MLSCQKYVKTTEAIVPINDSIETDNPLNYPTNFIEFIPGDFPLVISVPHGGSISPMYIPDRNCNNPVYATDVYTIEIAKLIDSFFQLFLGKKPFIIINHLSRTKLDCNRNLSDGTCNNDIAIKNWLAFHHFIDTAQLEISKNFNNQGFYVDLHGHGHKVQNIELGYLLYADELQLSDHLINELYYVNNSSIKNLALNNINMFNHSELLRGDSSLGSMFYYYNYPSVPSQQIPFPESEEEYYSGGYNLVNHSSYYSSSKLNGVQIELNYQGIRDNDINRRNFAKAFVLTLSNYLKLHFKTTY